MKSQTQIFIENLFLSCFSTLKVILLSRFRGDFKTEKIGEECNILANGPSLKHSLIEDLTFIASNPVLCVNNFVVSEYYEKVKPRYYVMIAPEFFMENPPAEKFLDMRNEMFNGIANKTTWPLILFVPYFTKKTDFWRNILSVNKNISIEYFNITPLEGFSSFINLFLKWNLGLPRPHNVLIPSIALALNSGYKTLNIFGADHSWHEDIKVNENNILTANHEHFYDSGKKIDAVYKKDGSNFRIYDMFRKISLAFKGYYVLETYAQALGAKVYNASKKSYIDAFERRKV